MKATRGLWTVLIIAAVGAVLAACGGDSGGSVADGGSSGTGISNGPVTAVGSITVNGRTLATDSAVIQVNEQTTTLDAIKPGHVVRVRADFAAGEAERVDFDPHIVGPVDARSLTNGTGTLTVLGQPVAITSRTVVAGYADAQEIAVGDRVRVSGLRGGDGGLQATRIEPAVDPTDRVIGVMHEPGIGGSDTDTLRMGGLVVDHSDASSAEFPGGEPTPGDRIAVAGQLAGDGSGVLNAERIAPHNPLPAEPGERIEMTGVLDGQAGTDSLAMAGVALDMAGATVEGGELADGARVRMTGTLTESNRVEVDTVVVDPE